MAQKAPRITQQWTGKTSLVAHDSGKAARDKGDEGQKAGKGM